MKYLFLLIFPLVVFNCGGSNDCEDLLCFTPPNHFSFEILDKETGENLFENGTLSPSNIKVKNLDTGEFLEFSFVDENEQFILIIPSIGWKTEKVHAKITLNAYLSFDLYVDAVRKNENCCSYTEFKEVKLENVEYEYVREKEQYKIYLIP